MTVEGEGDEGGAQGDGQGDGDTGGGDTGAGGGGHLSATERESIVAEILAALRGAGNGDSGGDKGAGEGAGDAGPGKRLIDQEAYWEQIVRRELERVKTAEDVASVKEEIKKIAERPPRQYKKVTRLLWGGGDDG